MNILSLFDGMSCGQIALNRAGVEITNYFASEIDKFAIQITQANYPDTVQLGDITKIKAKDLPKIDLLIGGSPCQGFSFAGKQLNFEDPRSKLFFEYVRLLKETKPLYFLLENVKMKKESQDIISKYLGVEPIEINSALVSAQNRKRLYWTNLPGIEQPEDRTLTLKDIVDLYNFGDDSCFTTTFLKEHIDFNSKNNQINKNMKYQWQGVYTKKMKTLNVGDGSRNYVYLPEIGVRKLTPEEAEKCQTVPIGYTKNTTVTNRFKMLGNGWTVDVAAHIFKDLDLL